MEMGGVAVHELLHGDLQLGGVGCRVRLHRHCIVHNLRMGFRLGRTFRGRGSGFNGRIAAAAA